MRFLNLGCGTAVSADASVTNIDWSLYLRLRRSRLLFALAKLVLDPTRRERLAAMPTNVLVHDLRKGIPAEDNSVDVVYHSHVLEHLDRDVAERFVAEIHRVLRPGGIHRIVVPNLEFAGRGYVESLDHGSEESHDRFVASLLEQSVRREAAGTSTKRQPRRWIENRLLGDARSRGETHQWMYDTKNLSALLKRCGFRDIEQLNWNTSHIADWPKYGLDRVTVDGAEREYLPHSLYVEAVK